VSYPDVGSCVVILSRLEQRIDVRHPPGGGNAELGRIAADGVRRHCHMSDDVKWNSVAGIGDGLHEPI